MNKFLIMFILVSLVFIMTACKSEENKREKTWEENSPYFNTEYGEMFGKEGKIGIKGGKAVTEKGQKWLWYFWGSKEIKNKTWEVKAFKQGEDEAINPITYNYDQKLLSRGDESMARSKVLFPSSGLWKLKVFIGGKFFGEFIVDITKK